MTCFYKGIFFRFFKSGKKRVYSSQKSYDFPYSEEALDLMFNIVVIVICMQFSYEIIGF
jgi:hypothetical protein